MEDYESESDNLIMNDIDDFVIINKKSKTDF